jgi:hypothetical protein
MLELIITKWRMRLDDQIDVKRIEHIEGNIINRGRVQRNFKKWIEMASMLSLHKRVAATNARKSVLILKAFRGWKNLWNMNDIRAVEWKERKLLKWGWRGLINSGKQKELEALLRADEMNNNRLKRRVLRPWFAEFDRRRCQTMEEDVEIVDGLLEKMPKKITYI